MPKRSRLYLVVLIFVASLTIIGIVVATLMSHPQSPKSFAKVHVDPSEVKRPQMGIFSISVKITNVISLYGLQITFSWDPSLLEYINRTAYIPVEDYSQGVLHEQVLEVDNTVDEAAGKYYIAYACVDPAPVFNGNGTVFTMTFRVIGFGQCALEIYYCKLVDKGGNEIPCALFDGDFTTSG